jgi:hypothetical protein
MTRRILFAAAALALAACGGGEPEADGSPTAAPTAAQRPSSTGELTIVEPEPGGVYPPDDVPVSLELEGATLSEVASTDLEPDEGHIHLTLDGELVTLLGGAEENLAELAEEPLEPGQHILEAEFVANDHGFFLPRVVQTVTFMVEG